MQGYNPNMPFNVAAYILKPTIKNVKGVNRKIYPPMESGLQIFCSAKSFGGTEQNKNGVFSVIDTVNIETWYTPEITSGDGFCFADSPNKIYDIVGEPENINRQNQFLKFKVMAVSGGA
jgi:hypothetical protein